jgi:AMP-binding enzyme
MITANATLSSLLLERASATPKASAIRQRRLGVWLDISWAGMASQAASIGNGLIARGVKSGDVVLIMADNVAEIVAAEYAVVGLGAIALLLPPDYSPDTVAALVTSQRVRLAIVGDQEQFDKIATGSVPNVVVMATRGLRHLEVAGRDDHDALCTLAQLEHDGNASTDWTTRAAQVTPQSPALRTTRIDGTDVVVEELNHTSLINAAAAAVTALGLGAHSDSLAQRSLAEADEQLLSVAVPALTGAQVAIGEGGVLGSAEVVQVQPSFMRPSPAWLAGIASDVDRQVSRTRGVKKLLLGSKFSGPVAITDLARSSNSSRRIPALAATRVIGLLTAGAVLEFLLLSVHVNDWIRLIVCFAIAILGGLAVAALPSSLPVPVRRRYGLSRLRGVVGQPDHFSDGARSLLGRLGVPFVSASVPAGTEVGRVASAVLSGRTSNGLAAAASVGVGVGQ